MTRTILRLLKAMVVIVPLMAAGPVLADLTAGSNSYLSIGVGDTVMTISGKTSPNAFVTIADFGQVIGTTVSGSDGLFLATFPAQSPDIHKPSVFVRASDGLFSETVLIPTSLYPHFTTDVQFFMPPTFSLAPWSVVRGQVVVVSGRGFPGSVVAVTIDNKVSYDTAVSSSGDWSLDVPTDELNFGTHSLFALNRTSSGEQSTPTRKQLFTVTKSTGIAATPPPSAPPTPRPQQYSSASANPIPLEVSVQQPLILIPVSETRIPVRIEKGTGPYTVRVDWGDGQIEEIVLDGTYVPLTHRYLRPGNYEVYVYAGDAAGAYKDTKIVLRVTSIATLIFNLIELIILFCFVLALLEGIHRRRLHFAY